MVKNFVGSYKGETFKFSWLDLHEYMIKFNSYDLHAYSQIKLVFMAYIIMPT
jgi:hypothetical protein